VSLLAASTNDCPGEEAIQEPGAILVRELPELRQLALVEPDAFTPRTFVKDHSLMDQLA